MRSAQKKIIIISIIAILIIITAAVIIYNSAVPGYGDFEGLVIESSTPLTELNNTITADEAIMMAGVSALDDFDEDVFPKAFKCKDGNIYTVYSVKNYGKLYFTYNSDSDQPQLESLLVIAKTKSDFDTLKIGESTFGDVMAVDPCAAYITGNVNKSYHQLQDGTAVTISYETADSGESIADAIIKNIEFNENNTLNGMFFDEDGLQAE